MNTVRQPLYFNELHNVPTKMRGLRREMEPLLGTAGMTIVADGGPKECTKCKSARIIKIADEWQ
jgi:hypothetical protein